ncbi:MAG: DUF2169 domain-containing protein [Byssovorax sp.]
MDVLSICPLRVSSLVWQPQAGSWAMTVVCKATYRLSPGSSALAEPQEYPNEEENHWNDDPARSVYAPSDLAPFKPSPEVMIVGQAFAPRGEPVSRLFARVIVGEVDKSIEVCADEAFAPDGTLREGPRFSKMQLRYERASGGPETSNPVGIRLDAQSSLGLSQVPNLRPPGTAIIDRHDFIEPACFGPIASTWPTRRMYLARLAGPWTEDAFADEPMPEGFDSRYFLVAPRDQALGALRPDERIILENLHPELPRLVTNLPGVEPRAFVDGPERAPWELKLTCDTLWIDTERSICTLTWRGQLRLEGREQVGRVIVAMASAGHALSWADVARQMPLPGGEASPSSAGPPPAATLTFVGPMSSRPREPSGPAWLKSERLSMLRSLPAPTALAPSAALFPQAQSIVASSPWAAPGAAPAPFVATPAPEPVVIRDAAARGVAASSDAAAGAAAIGAGLVAKALAPTSDSRPAADLRSAPPPGGENVDLIWFERDEVSRILATAPPDALRSVAVSWLKSDSGPRTEPLEVQDRRHILRVVAREAALDDAGVVAAVAVALRRSAGFEPPVVLVVGELRVTFDELETLRATLAVATPFLGTDKKLRDAVGAATEALKAEWPIPGDIADGHTARVEEAFGQSVRAVAPGYLRATVERLLLEGRRYQKRTLFGDRRIRVQLALAGGAEPTPAYLPEAVGPRLPLFQRFKARAIVEVRPQEDQYETHGNALVILALGRVLRDRRAP